MNTRRRQFLQAAAVAACTPLVARDAVTGPTLLQLGIAGYSFLHYRDNLAKAIEVLQTVGISNITLKDFHLPFEASAEQSAAILRQLSNAGISVYGLGVIYMKSADEVNRAFRYAKQAGIGMVVGSPLPELLPQVEQQVRETGIRLAIHNHGPEDKVYPDIDTIHRHINKLDQRIGICLDIGHSFRCGHRPDRMLKQFANRIIDMHIKDVTLQKPDGQSTIPGRGILPLREVLATAKSVKYSGFMSLEYERPGDPAMGIAESIGYLRGLMRGID